MVAVEEPGLLRFYIESQSGDKQILLGSIRTELLSTTTIASRPRIDVASSVVAQILAPTPTTGRIVFTIPRHVVTQNGYLVVAHKSDAADTEDTSDSKYNVSVVQRDLTKIGTPLEFRIRQLTLADRDTNRVVDDTAFTTTDYSDRCAFKCPTGLEWMMHAEHEVQVMDDTA